MSIQELPPAFVVVVWFLLVAVLVATIYLLCLLDALVVFVKYRVAVERALSRKTLTALERGD